MAAWPAGIRRRFLTFRHRLTDRSRQRLRFYCPQFRQILLGVRRQALADIDPIDSRDEIRQHGEPDDPPTDPTQGTLRDSRRFHLPFLGLLAVRSSVICANFRGATAPKKPQLRQCSPVQNQSPQRENNSTQKIIPVQPRSTATNI